ncbi:50S ribosomal protein L11 [Candidatus Pacearchaeota archaeon]|nr:50S ribosomal protein L11 [Candidatus Pacearchaeota archaeon]|tara:strand:- start:3639 stop:4391 length:753 start_codon:yes stop_codon:yes gene_type:complete
MKVKLLVDGGKMAPGPAVAQQLGPMGINLGKVIEDVNEATKSFSGTKVPVELDVDPKTKSYEIQVFSPPVAELIKKSLSLEKGSGEAGKYKVGNASIESLIGIAKTKSPDLLAKDLKAALKLIVGTCVSLGILIDNKDPKEIQSEIDSGNYDTEIKEEKTEPSPEKKLKLEKFFKVRKAQQEKQKVAEEAAAAEAEAEKEKAKIAAAAAEAGEGEAPAEGEEAKEGETPEGEAPAEGEEAKEAPAEEKKE